MSISHVPTNTAASTRPAPPSPRSPRSGIALLPALFVIVIVMGLLAVLQARSLAQTRVAGGLLTADRSALHGRAVDALATGQIARALIQPETGTPAWPVNGTPMPISFDGRDYTVALQDVAGLVDLYLAPPALLDAVGLPRTRILALRERLATQPFARLPSLAQTGAALALNADQAGIVTQSGDAGTLNPDHSPPALAARLGRLDPSLTSRAQPRRVSVTVRPAP